MKDFEIDIYGKITKPQIIGPSDDPGRRPSLNPVENKKHHIDGLMRERRNSITKILEPRPSPAKPSTYIVQGYQRV